ncbi:MAG: carbamoyl-phosphate synthase large subunit, partial [Clostridiales bacterium]|nr:carbamoyl-phosphate synthase large subunit [Clostridiales bacterium]
FPDAMIADIAEVDELALRRARKVLGIEPVYKMVDTCAAEFEAETPYYYSTFDEKSEVKEPSGKKKIMVLGSGPIRIGQGIEFDYCSVHCVWALRRNGYEAVIVNNNPETVSTDFDTSDRLYFEPLTPEDVEGIIKAENPDAVVVQFGGQTAIKLSKHMERLGLKILGTPAWSIDAAEDREKFDKILEECHIPRPQGGTVFTEEEAIKTANSLGYPVLVRPSYVLGGQGMEIANSDEDIAEFMRIINRTKQENPVLVDKYMMGREIEVDAICDGTDILIPGVMEHLERAGVHSGDSISVYPSISLEQRHIDTIVEYTKRLAMSLKVVGLVNVQFVLFNDAIYVIEVNPRSSRTVPYISKITGVPMVDLATRCMLGKKLRDMEYGVGLYPTKEYYAVKVPVFSFQKLHNVDTQLGPEMKSTGEVLGVSKRFRTALLKGLVGSGLAMKKKGAVLISVKDSDKQEVIQLADRFLHLGFDLYATPGTANVLNKHMIACSSVRGLDQPEPNMMTLLESGKIDYVISTSQKGRKPELNAVKLRRKTVERSIPCLTAIDTASALLRCLEGDIKVENSEMVDINEV